MKSSLIWVERVYCLCQRWSIAGKTIEAAQFTDIIQKTRLSLKLSNCEFKQSINVLLPFNFQEGLICHDLAVPIFDSTF